MDFSESTAVATATQSGPTLQELYERGDHYAVVNVSLRRLTRDPTDGPAAAFACRSYISLGLIGPARELSADPAGPLAGQSDLRNLHDQIGKLPSGRVGWNALQPRFEANLAALYAARPELRAHDDVFRSIPRTLELFRSADGNLHVSIRAAGELRRWLPGLRDGQRLAGNTRLPHDPKALFCGPYLVFGDSGGVLFDRVFEGTDQMFLTFRPRIYVLEPDPRAFGVVLYTCETVDRWCQERAHVFVGPDCLDALKQFLRDRPTLPPPQYMVRGPGPEADVQQRVTDVIEALNVDRERHARSAIATASQHYGALSAARWAQRWAERDARPLRVLGMTSRFTTFLQYSMRDWEAAFRRLGHEFRLLIEANDHDLLTSISIANAVAEYKPDLIVMIDHLRREYQPVVPANVPVVGWIQDDLPNLMRAEAGRSLGPLDFVCGFSKDSYVHQYDYPPESFLPCVIPTNRDVYTPEPVPPADRERHLCDVSATTHASRTPEQMRDDYAIRLPDDRARALLHRIYDEVRDRISREEFLTSGRLLEIVIDCEQSTGVRIADHRVRMGVFNDFATRLHDRTIRHRTLGWVARWAQHTGRRFALYGNGWQKHPELGPYARGPVANGYDLRCVYQASTINLHVSGFGSIHQRVLDGTASGGFFLVQHNPADFVGEAVIRLAEIATREGARTVDDLLALRSAEVETAIQQFRRVHAFGLVGPDDPDRLARRRWCFGKQPGASSPPRPLADRLAAIAENPTNASLRLPRFAEITFADEAEFAERAEHFLAHPDQRRAIADEMRQAVLREFTYDGFTRTLLEFIHQRLMDARERDPAGGAGCKEGSC